MNFSRLELTI